MIDFLIISTFVLSVIGLLITAMEAYAFGPIRGYKSYLLPTVVGLTIMMITGSIVIGM